MDAVHEQAGSRSAAACQSTSWVFGSLLANVVTARLSPSTETPLSGGRLSVATTRQRSPAIWRAARRSAAERLGFAGSSLVPRSNTTTSSSAEIFDRRIANADAARAADLRVERHRLPAELLAQVRAGADPEAVAHVEHGGARARRDEEAGGYCEPEEAADHPPILAGGRPNLRASTSESSNSAYSGAIEISIVTGSVPGSSIARIAITSTA